MSGLITIINAVYFIKFCLFHCRCEKIIWKLIHFQQSPILLQTNKQTIATHQPTFTKTNKGCKNTQPSSSTQKAVSCDDVIQCNPTPAPGPQVLLQNRIFTSKVEITLKILEVMFNFISRWSTTSKRL